MQLGSTQVSYTVAVAFRVWIKICGDIRNGKSTPRYLPCRELLTPCIVHMGNCRLCVLLIWGIADSSNRWYGELPTLRIWYGELPTLRIVDMRNCLLKNFLETVSIVDTESLQLCALLIRRVADSAYHWYGDSSTLRIVDTESLWLCISLIEIEIWSQFIQLIKGSPVAQSHAFKETCWETWRVKLKFWNKGLPTSHNLGDSPHCW